MKTERALIVGLTIGSAFAMVAGMGPVAVILLAGATVIFIMSVAHRALSVDACPTDNYEVPTGTANSEEEIVVHEIDHHETIMYRRRAGDRRVHRYVFGGESSGQAGAQVGSGPDREDRRRLEARSRPQIEVGKDDRQSAGRVLLPRGSSRRSYDDED